MATKYPPSSLEVEIAALALGALAWLVTGSPLVGIAGGLFGVLLFLRRYLALERSARRELEERLARLEARH